MTSFPRCRQAASFFFLLIASFAVFTRTLPATEYTFTTIASNQDTFTGIFVHSAQPLNDNGEVGFFGERPDHFQGIYKSDGSTLATIATYSQMFLNTGFTGGISDGGSVIFRGDGGAYQRALYGGSGGPLTTYLYENTIDPSPAWIITGAVTNNDSDQAAFSGGWISDPTSPNPTTRAGFYRVNGPGGSVTVMAETGHGVYDGAAAVPPALNDAGQGAFMMSTVADGTYHIIRYDNPGLTTIASGYTGGQILSMNDAGDVAFVNQNSTAVQVYRNGGIETIASTADGFNLIFQGEQHINNDGDIAFSGTVIEHEGNPVEWNGVFNGPDPANDQVLLYGDSLFDSTVAELKLLDLNNNGQILMMVGLQEPENWRGLVLATPVPAYSADFDGDGDVDSDDLDEWQAAYGVNSLADADGDGDSDGADFLAWQRQFGSGLEPPVEIIRAVPEPTTLMLLLVGCSCLGRRSGESD